MAGRLACLLDDTDSMNREQITTFKKECISRVNLLRADHIIERFKQQLSELLRMADQLME